MDLDGLDLDEQVRDLPLPFLRMLDLARALAFDPQLLLLDEITAALPPGPVGAGLRRDAAVEGAQPLGAVHLPPPGRGARALRHVHGAARRSRRGVVRAGRGRRGADRVGDARRGGDRAFATRCAPGPRRVGDRRSTGARSGARRCRPPAGGRLARRRGRRGARARRPGGPGPGDAVRHPRRQPQGRPGPAADRRSAPSRRATRSTSSARVSCSCLPTACTPCCRSARSGRTSPPRCSTASPGGARSTVARSVVGCRMPSTGCPSTPAPRARCAGCPAATSRR